MARPRPRRQPARVVATAPVNTAAPTISGQVQQGQTLTEVHGCWTNTPTSYSYQWLRCSATATNCAAITGATGETYLLALADVGQTIEVQETAINGGGPSAVATSAATSVVLPAAPTNTAPPTISGTAQQEDTLTEAHGSWTGSPTSYAYQWLQCSSTGTSCEAIGSATSQTYVPVAADVGKTIAVQEQPINAGGPSSPATSAPTAVVAAAPSRGTSPHPQSSVARRKTKPSARQTANGPTPRPPTPTSGCSATAPARTATRSRAPPRRPT